MRGCLILFALFATSFRGHRVFCFHLLEPQLALAVDPGNRSGANSIHHGAQELSANGRGGGAEK